MDEQQSVKEDQEESLVSDRLTYQQQIERMLRSVDDGETHLFSSEEWHILHQFNALSGRPIFY